jgi:chaperonin GroES
MSTTFVPIYDRVLVVRSEAEEVSSSGLVILETSQLREKPSTGIVVAVGTGRVNDLGTVSPLIVKEGDKVLFGKYAGTDIKLEGKEFLMMREEDILGIIKESSIVSLG